MKFRDRRSVGLKRGSQADAKVWLEYTIVHCTNIQLAQLKLGQDPSARPHNEVEIAHPICKSILLRETVHNPPHPVHVPVYYSSTNSSPCTAARFRRCNVVHVSKSPSLLSGPRSIHLNTRITDEHVWNGKAYRRFFT